MIGSHSRQYRICLLGCSLNTGNEGVSALTTAVVAVLREELPGVQVKLLLGEQTSAAQQVLLAGRQDVTVEVVNYRLSPRSRIGEHLACIAAVALFQRCIPFAKLRDAVVRANRWVEAVHEADVVADIYGGDSFSDIYGLWRFLLSVIPRIIVLLVRKKIVFLPQTYGPFRSVVGKWMADFVVRGATAILCRDRLSLRYLTHTFGASLGAPVAYCPDVAFAMDPVEPLFDGGGLRCLSREPAGNQHRRALVGLNISGLLYRGGYTRRNMFNLRLDYRAFVLCLASAIIQATDADLLLVPHNSGAPGTVNNDRDACNDVFRAVEATAQGRLHLLPDGYRAPELKWIIGHCDVFVGSRLHSCIAALSQGVKTVGIAYSRKFAGVFESVGFGHWVVDARKSDGPAALEKTLALIKHPHDNPREHKKIAEMAKREVHDRLRSLVLREAAVRRLPRTIRDQQATV